MIKRFVWERAVPAAAVAVVVASIFIGVDSWYFGHLTVAPLNNLIYNLNPDNLALHGLHPFYLHGTVNIFLLFGPLALFFYWAVLQALWILVQQRCRVTKLSTKTSSPHPFHLRQLSSNDNNRERKAAIAWNAITVCCLLSVAVPLVLLSRAPHQEARFLLPLFTPLFLLLAVAAPHWLRHAHAWKLWLLFNLSLALFYGWVHQGGVVKALAWSHFHSNELISSSASSLSSSSSSTYSTMNPVVHVFFWNTYMPPVHLASIEPWLPLRITDTRSMELSQLLHTISQAAETFRFVVCPRTDAQQLPATWSLHTSFFPHFSGESPPSSFSDLHLDVFSIPS